MLGVIANILFAMVYLLSWEQPSVLEMEHVYPLMIVNAILALEDISVNLLIAMVFFLMIAVSVLTEVNVCILIHVNAMLAMATLPALLQYVMEFLVPHRLFV